MLFIDNRTRQIKQSSAVIFVAQESGYATLYDSEEETREVL
jgi:hypothetical protein